jgi:hypothetical protein
MQGIQLIDDEIGRIDRPKTISEESRRNCAIERITFPESITSIDRIDRSIDANVSIPLHRSDNI